MSYVNPVNKAFCLEKLCESNYQKLFRLIPRLRLIKQCSLGYSNSAAPLHLKILEKTAHTLTLQLSHCFDKNLIEFLEPTMKVRIYLDARVAEVIRDHADADVSRKIKHLEHARAVLDYKWSLNYFLEKWLNHCLQSHYQFDDEVLPVAEMS